MTKVKLAYLPDISASLFQQTDRVIDQLKYAGPAVARNDNPRSGIALSDVPERAA